MKFQDYIKRYEVRGNFSDPNLIFKRLKDIPKMLDRIDFDVYLPSIGKNLQRPLCWEVEQKRELIYSILLKRYIPPIKYISLITDGEDIIQVIDGKQRLSAMLQFLNNGFAIEIQDKYYLYSELPEDFKSEIDYYHVTGQAMYQQYDSNSNIIPIFDEVKIKWFNLINFAGTPQDKSHMESLIIA